MEGGVMDLIQKIPESKGAAQHHHKDDAQQGAQKFHSLPGGGIFSLHDIQ
jgi:hypothetical protein